MKNKTPLHIALENNLPEIVSLLILKGAKLNAKDIKHQNLTILL